VGILLEIKAGPLAGKKISVVTGQTVTFGRAEGRAEIALPHDTFMSGVHFAVECSAQGCRVQDRKSSNGTFLNGARVQDAMLANGDEIKGGQTSFSVKILADAKLADFAVAQEVREPQAPQAAQKIVPAPPAAAVPPVVRPVEEPKPAASNAAPVKPAVQAPPPSRAPIAEPEPVAPPVPKPGIRPDAGAGAKLSAPAFSVMGWSFTAIPEKWEIQQEFGLQRNAAGEFPSSLAASEEGLGGITLQQFVESQISMLRQYLRDPKIEPMMPPRVGGAEESMAVDVRHSTKDGKELVYRRIYARSGSSVGVLTVTTLAADLPQVLESLQPLLDGAAFRSTVHN
jgi:predicted component of type VI protein secretion system